MNNLRICDRCLIYWEPKREKKKSCDCPKCGIDSFFTSNANDIGTFIYFEQNGLSLNDYAYYEVDDER